ncbi:MAG: DNA glycosylase [Actinobacteria bacterium]|nr:DNA glycosylase [Actinomycetota bacterium]
MPEGDSIHRVARNLQALVGERLEVETPHPRAAVLNIAERLDGQRLERVEAVGKNLFLRFEGGLTLRSHLRMNGRWRVRPRGEPLRGRPWLLLRSRELEALQWNGPVLELSDSILRRLGPDILERPPRIAAMTYRLLRASGLPLAEALQRQELVAGIGNMWAAEVLWEVRLSPWVPVRDVSDGDLERVLREAHRLMSSALGGSRPARRAYRRAGRPCRRCGAIILSLGQGDANRTAYWCPTCQPPPRSSSSTISST